MLKLFIGPFMTYHCHNILFFYKNDYDISIQKQLKRFWLVALNELHVHFEGNKHCESIAHFTKIIESQQTEGKPKVPLSNVPNIK
jgi:hypothetical protein